MEHRRPYPTELSAAEWRPLALLLAPRGSVAGRRSGRVGRSPQPVMADAAARLPTLANGLRPFPPALARRLAAEGARSFARARPRRRGTRAQPECRGDRQPIGAPWRPGAWPRRRRAAEGPQAPPARGHHRPRALGLRPRRGPPRPPRWSAPPHGRPGGGPAAPRAGVGRGRRRGRLSAVGARRAWLARRDRAPSRPAAPTARADR